MVVDLFPTPIYIKKFETEKLSILNEEIDNKLSDEIFYTRNDFGNTHYLSNDFSECIISKLNLTKFKNELDLCIRDYCNKLSFNCTEYKTESWFTLFRKGNYGHAHDHGGANISGVYYYKTNGEDGNLKFYSPVVQASSSDCFAKYSASKEIIQPEIGMLVLFPGYLMHEISINNTDNVRISLSFNIDFKNF